MMRLAITIAFGTTIAGCATYPSPVERVTLIDPALGERATTTCSRAGPENPTRFFTPTPREVTAIESAAMRLLRSRADEYRALLPDSNGVEPGPFDWPNEPALYARQYIGYYENGRRMIYGNYYPAQFRSDPGEPLVLCDGGYTLFGVEYDVESRSVRRIAFDGSLRGPLLPPIEP